MRNHSVLAIRISFIYSKGIISLGFSGISAYDLNLAIAPLSGSTIINLGYSISLKKLTLSTYPVKIGGLFGRLIKKLYNKYKFILHF